MTEDEPSRCLVDQRVRNRIIEYLELAASYELQIEYERAVPIVHVPSEVINQWEDWVPVDPRVGAEHPDVYSIEEVAAICQYHSVWDRVADEVPNGFPTLRTVQALQSWDELRQAALAARIVFERRGKMPDDQLVAR